MNKTLIIEILKQIGHAVCDKVYASVNQHDVEHMSKVHHEGEDDTIYQIDKDVEDIIVPMLNLHARSLGGIVLLAEGIGDPLHGMVLPSELNAKSAALRIIIDPIDGTRGIMYNKRPGFFLAGVAANHGVETTLNDIVLAVMTELPISKNYTSDTLWTTRGHKPHAERRNLITNVVKKLELKPSKSNTILGGYAQLARFFPPGRDILSKIEDELIETLFSAQLQSGRAIVFEDQYISTGGQLYEMLMGHDRFIADLRPLLYKKLFGSGTKPGHVCHPYDACTFLIGHEAGLIFTDGYGNSFDAPMDLLSDVSWCAYANRHICDEVQPHLQKLVHKYLTV
ncbi:MAG: hypothetical protein NW207_01695 [Cytophagales bacterium]|nr:hypothetical protein [Cytophagales bacterium]